MIKKKEFENILREYSALFDELISFENEKLETIIRDDAEAVESMMKDEQVFLLRLRGLDAKREKLQVEMGIPGLTFRQIILQCESEEGTGLENLLEELSRKTAELKSVSQSAKSFIELHLHSIDRIIAGLGGSSAEQAAYDKNGAQALSRTSRFEPKRV